jgi:hypothetical protein
MRTDAEIIALVAEAERIDDLDMLNVPEIDFGKTCDWIALDGMVRLADGRAVVKSRTGVISIETLKADIEISCRVFTNPKQNILGPCDELARTLDRRPKGSVAYPCPIRGTGAMDGETE